MSVSPIFQSVPRQTVRELFAHAAFVVMVRILWLIATDRWHTTGVRCSDKSMLQNRPAYTAAKWSKLTVGLSWSVYNRLR